MRCRHRIHTARRDGRQQASTSTAASTAGTVTKTTGLVALTP